ncbi:MAG: hypothetical protein Q9216_007079 [Gyalolechia sp. 2 TL-2023]
MPPGTHYGQSKERAITISAHRYVHPPILERELPQALSSPQPFLDSMAEVAQIPPIAPIDPDSYKWKQLDTDPLVWQRRACGAEAIVGIQENMAKGEYDLFYATTVELHTKQHSLQDLKLAARAAWRLLRYQEPQIAGTAASDGQLKALLQYRVPETEEEVNNWLERTILVEASDRSPMAIRDSQEEERKRENLGASESATIYLAASVPDETTPLADTELRFLFRINHLFFDGIGFRCMIASFFRGLAAELAKGSSTAGDALDWKKSADHLRPAYINLLVPEQQVSGPEYDKSLQEQLGGLMRGLNNWGIEPKSYVGNGPSKTLWRTFTLDQSQQIVRAVKQRLGPGYTITHLGQSALLLALLKIHPPGPEVGSDQIYECSSPVNARRFIQEPYQSYREPYFPLCQANGFVIFEDIKSFAQEGERQDDKTKELLTRASKASKDGYAAILNRPHSLAVGTSIMEMITGLIAYYGIQEKYLPRDYAADNGDQVLSIKDVYFWLNLHASFPSVRLSSWRDVSRMSVDYNTACYDEAVMKALLDDVADLMLLFAS